VLRAAPWLVALAGIGAAYRLSRRRRSMTPPAPVAGSDADTDTWLPDADDLSSLDPT